MKIKIAIWMIVVALVAGITELVSTYFTTKKVVKYERKINALQTINTVYKAQIVSYRKSNDSLQRQLKSNDSVLAVLKKKSAEIKERIVVKVVKQKVPTMPPPTDQQRLADCDSLQTLLMQYVNVQDSKDSIQGAIDTTVSNLFTLKDKQIAACDSAYDRVTEELTKSLEREMQYEEQIIKLEKKVKRKTFWETVTGTASIVALSVAGIHLISK